MSSSNSPKWLEWARQIQQLCQTGLAFSESEYDTARYKQLAELAAEIVASHSGLDSSALSENFLAHPGYATPKVDIRAAIIKNDKILLVQEAVDNKWAMPGGWADVGESPSEAIIRETKEESGLDIIPKKIIGVYNANRDGRPLELYHAYKIIFLCEVIGGELRSSKETLDAKYFIFDDIPTLSTSRTSSNQISNAYSMYSNPDTSTVFE